MTKPVVTAMGEIVQKVSDAILTDLKSKDETIQAINYLYGHWVEVSATLQSMSQDSALRYQKFPLILLIEDFGVDEGAGDYSSVQLQMLICHHTNPSYLSEQRQTEVFDKTLDPLYNELITQICKSNYFVQKHHTKVKRKKIDRKYLGKEAVYGNTANIALEYIDAIQIQNMELTINKPYCIVTTNRI